MPETQRMPEGFLSQTIAFWFVFNLSSVKEMSWQNDRRDSFAAHRPLRRADNPMLEIVRFREEWPGLADCLCERDLPSRGHTATAQVPLRPREGLRLALLRR
jgi:hypothetical protein